MLKNFIRPNSLRHLGTGLSLYDGRMSHAQQRRQSRRGVSHQNTGVVRAKNCRRLSRQHRGRLSRQSVRFRAKM
eukprot:4785698-Pleurochrysis_carterae.AAC.1